MERGMVLVSGFYDPVGEHLLGELEHFHGAGVAGQVEMVLDGLGAMVEWSLSARRGQEVVSKMYEASKRPVTRTGSPRLTATGRYINGFQNGNMNGNINDDTNMAHNGQVHDMNGVQASHQGQTEMLMEEGLIT